VLVVWTAHNSVVVFDGYLSKEEEKEPAEQRSSARTSPLAPYVIASSTHSKAQAPNPNNAREAFPTKGTAALRGRSMPGKFWTLLASANVGVVEPVGGMGESGGGTDGTNGADGVEQRALHPSRTQSTVQSDIRVLQRKLLRGGVSREGVARQHRHYASAPVGGATEKRRKHAIAAHPSGSKEENGKITVGYYSAAGFRGGGGVWPDRAYSHPHLRFGWSQRT